VSVRRKAVAVDKETFVLNYGKLVARTWQDPEYLNALKNDPIGTLKEAGIDVPDNATVRVVIMEPTGAGSGDEQWEYWQKGEESGVYDLFVPTKPEDLDSAAMAQSGGTYTCSCTPCCCCT
jgi:hypothetical protein